MKALNNEDLGKYEFRKEYMKDQQDQERGGCLPIATLFVVIMLSMIGCGAWIIWH